MLHIAVSSGLHPTDKKVRSSESTVWLDTSDASESAEALTGEASSTPWCSHATIARLAEEAKRKLSSDADTTIVCRVPRGKASAGDDKETVRISVPLMGDAQANTALGDSEDGTVFIGHLDKYEGKWGPPPVPRVEGEPPIEAPLDAPAWGDAPEADLGFFVDASTEKPASVDIAVRYMAEWDEVRVDT